MVSNESGTPADTSCACAYDTGHAAHINPRKKSLRYCFIVLSVIRLTLLTLITIKIKKIPVRLQVFRYFSAKKRNFVQTKNDNTYGIPPSRSPRRPDCMDGCNRRYSEHIQAIMPSEGMYLRIVHRRFHYGIHQPDGHRNQTRRLCDTPSRHHHPVSRTERKGTDRFCRVLRALSQRSQHHPIHHELVLQDYRSSRDTAQRNRRLLLQGLLRIAGTRFHRTVHAQNANGAERA